MLPLPPRYEFRRTLAAGPGAVAAWVYDRELSREGVLLTPAVAGVSEPGMLEDGRPFAVLEPEAVPEALAALREAAADESARAQAYRFEGTTLMALGQLPAARAALEAGAAIESKLGLDGELAASRLNLGFLAIEQADFEAALRYAEQVQALPAGAGAGFPAAFARVLAGKARLFKGDASGEAEFTAGLEAVGALGNPGATFGALGHWIETLIKLRRWQEAADTLAKARELARLTGAGDPDGRLARFETAIARGVAAPEAALVVRSVPAGKRERLAEQMAAISAEADLQGVLDKALAAFVEVANAERGFLLLYQGYKVVQQVFYGMAAPESDEYSSGLAYQVLWSGEPVYIEDVQQHPELGQHDSIQALGLRSVLGVPLLDGETVIGVMLADSQSIHTGFGPDEMALATALARQAAIAIVNVRRLERYKSGYEELEVLHRLALAGTQAADLDALMAQVAAEAAALSGAERVVLLEGEALACRVAFSDSGERLTGDRAAISRTVARWVYENAQPLHLLDAQNEEGFSMQNSVMALGLRTIEAVPVTRDGKTLGVLYTDNQRVVEAPAGTLKTLARMAEVVGAFMARKR